MKGEYMLELRIESVTVEDWTADRRQTDRQRDEEVITSKQVVVCVSSQLLVNRDDYRQ